MRAEASWEDIRAEVQRMGLGWLNSLLTRWILRWLRKRAYSQEEFYQCSTSVGENVIAQADIAAKILVAVRL
jgi:hypothetical protein